VSKIHQVCILGGTGFVGRHIVAQLAKQKHNVRVLSRHRERHRDLLVMPTVEVNEASVHDPQALKEQFQGCDTVINLVGILHERGRKTESFQGAHVELARKVAEACKANGIRRLLHMSALTADAGRGASRYLRSKGEAENLVHTTKDLITTSFRPSVIFGPEDMFLNKFAHMMKITPGWFPVPLACPNAKFAPIWVEDVARAYVQAIDDKTTYGQHYDLCGPNVYTLKQIMEFVDKLIGKKHKIIGLGRGMSKMQAMMLGMLPGKVMTLDNYRSMQHDNVCDGPFPSVFGFSPTAMEAIAPGYLADGRYRSRYTKYRRLLRGQD
jgi:NADH dehydrogenase